LDAVNKVTELGAGVVVVVVVDAGVAANDARLIFSSRANCFNVLAAASSTTSWGVRDRAC
jgi:hypothetical protein